MFVALKSGDGGDNMSTFTAIMASIMMLATTAFGKGWAAAPTGVDKPVAYVPRPIPESGQWERPKTERTASY